MQVVTIADSGPWVTGAGPDLFEPFKSDSTPLRPSERALKMASPTNKNHNSRHYSVLLEDDYGIIDVVIRVEDGLQRLKDLGRKDFKELCRNWWWEFMTLRTTICRLTVFWRILGNWSWVIG
ncbi:hypothetical protein TorRG33x02_342450 [Trema orientale]|uniref:Uncharacterized protein n=1 Tax=Trema orientale TaxID=63057 RepID=A0A2P5ASJ6_TREOI|nr:hypothetical protein TorRG33x02_342450 [Trema orientale]